MEVTPSKDPMGLWTTFRHLTATHRMLEQWQESRFRFAHAVGGLLVGSIGDRPAVTGPALYGVYLSDTRLVYVGQTQEAQRRLRDLPIGESHHIATTIPPEIWERVVVVQWPALVGLASSSQQEQIGALGPEVCGLALEHILQFHRRPLLNGRIRTSAGEWRLRDPERSRSRGARYASNCAELFELVEQEWNALEAISLPQSQDGAFRVRDSGRVVFPSALLNASHSL